MNMDKTKVILIGRKRYSKEKLSVNYKIQQFTLFHAWINYAGTLEDIRKEMVK